MENKPINRKGYFRFNTFEHDNFIKIEKQNIVQDYKDRSVIFSNTDSIRHLTLSIAIYNKRVNASLYAFKINKKKII